MVTGYAIYTIKIQVLLMFAYLSTQTSLSLWLIPR